MQQTRWIDDKVPDTGLPDNPLADGLRTLGVFDQGGILAPGALAFNASNKPEAVFNHRQFQAFAERAGTQNGSGTFSGRITMTNWEEGRGYFESVAQDEIQAEREYENSMGRMR